MTAIVKKWKIEDNLNATLPGAFALYFWRDEYQQWERKFTGSLSDRYAYRQLTVLGDVDLDIM